MTINRKIVWIFFLTPILLGFGSSFGADDSRPGSSWPQWRGPNRDGRSPDSGLLVRWSEKEPPVVWRVTGGTGFSSLAIVDGHVYTMVQRDDFQWALCLDAHTGREIWRVKSGAMYREQQGGDGPRSTPTVDADRVYSLDAGGNLLCLNRTTGKIMWQQNILERFNAQNLIWGVSASPLIDGENLLLNVGGAGAGFVALNKYTGEVIWKAHDDVAGYSSPIIITNGDVREVVFFAGRAVVGLAPQDGRLHWRHEWRTTDDMNVATPIWANPFLFVSSGRGTGAGLFRLDAKGDVLCAEVVWTSKVMQNHFNSCVPVGEHLYGFDNAILKCIELKTGKELWSDRSVGKGSLVFADGHLFIVGEHGDIAVAEATPQGYRELGRKRVLEYRAWTPPAIAYGRLYVRDQQTISCLDLRR
jgi:outer membrane protein assembly factor BamB